MEECKFLFHFIVLTLTIAATKMVLGDEECVVTFEKSKTLDIKDDVKDSILSALKVDDADTCAQFCCEYDINDVSSSTPCGAALFSEGNNDEEEAESTLAEEQLIGSRKNDHNCFLFSCSLGVDCTNTIDSSSQVTTILIETTRETTSINTADFSYDVITSETPEQEEMDEIFNTLPQAQAEKVTSSRAAVVTFLVCFICFGTVAFAAIGHYFFLQYQKRKLYYKLDKMDSGGDYFATAD